MASRRRTVEEVLELCERSDPDENSFSADGEQDYFAEVQERLNKQYKP